MYNMRVCPMMQQSYAQMPNMMMDDMYDMPVNTMPMHNMPMHNVPMHNVHNNTPMADKVNIMNIEKAEMNVFEENEKDENHYMEMMPDHCKKMMPYIDKVLDRVEDKDEQMYSKLMDKKMIQDMTEEAYKDIIREMPDLVKDNEPSRQYGPRGFVRDLAGVLLVNELLRRRRRRRYFDYGYGAPYYGAPYYGAPYFGGSPYFREYDDSINYEDYYINDME